MVSFDDFVGERQQLVRDAEAKRLGGLHIDHEFEPNGLLDRQIGRLGAFEDLAGVDTDLAIAIADADAVAHEPAGSDVIAELIHRRQLELRRQRHDPFAPRIEEGVGGDEQCGHTLLHERGECRFEPALE